MTDDRPLSGLIESEFPEYETSVWRLRPNAAVDVPSNYPVVGWRCVGLRPTPEGGVELCNVPAGAPARSIDAAHGGVDAARFYRDCTSNDMIPVGPFMPRDDAPSNAAPCVDAHCGYRIVRSWTMLVDYWLTQADLARRVGGDPPLLLARVRASGRVASTTEWSDPVNTLRVQRFVIDALLMDMTTASYQLPLRDTYPSIATALAVDHTLPELRALAGGTRHAPTYAGNIARFANALLKNTATPG